MCSRWFFAALAARCCAAQLPLLRERVQRDLLGEALQMSVMRPPSAAEAAAITLARRQVRTER
jgi:hypothetical protein